MQCLTGLRSLAGGHDYVRDFSFFSLIHCHNLTCPVFEHHIRIAAPSSAATARVLSQHTTSEEGINGKNLHR
jgi:hypothetical protein